MNEIWKDIEGFEGYYQISNMGRVKSLSRNIINKDGKLHPVKEKILKMTFQKRNGRIHVKLNKDNKCKYFYVHRLVAETFIPNPDNLSQVNHKDENPSNNCVDNLEWCTEEYNHNYGTRNDRNAKGCQKKINVYNLNMNYIETLDSLKEMSIKYNVDQSNVTKVCKGIYKHINRYIVKYA